MYKLLKLDPGNAELMGQKQRLLAQAVSETKGKLDALKLDGQQANDALARGGISQSQYDALQREIVETEKALEELAVSVGEILMLSIRQIVEWVQGLVDWLNRLSSFFTSCWQGIQTMFTTVLTAISTFFGSIWTGIQTVVVTIGTAIQTFLTTVWNTIKTVITTILAAIQTVFTTVWNVIKNVVTAVVGAIQSFITAAWNGIRLVVQTVMNAIRSYIHFSVPDVGPLTDYETWMPDFMGGLVKGIERSKGLVQKAVDGVAADMVISPGVSAMEGAQVQTASVDFVRQMMSGIQEMFAGM